METEALRAVLEAIPRGRWMSYGDVAHAAGGTGQHARGLNGRLQREGLPNAHRVLKSDGSVGATALGPPDTIRRQLEAEGIEFTDGRADPARRLQSQPAGV